MAENSARAALEKAFEHSGHNFEEKSEPVQSSGVDDSPSTVDTSLNDDAVAKHIAKAKTSVSGDEGDDDAKKIIADSKSEPGNENGGKEPSVKSPPTPPVQVEDAPQYWKAEDRAAWAKVPAELRPILKKYEDMRNAGFARLKQAANEKIGQWADASFEAVFPAERMRAIAMEQTTPAAATAALWAWNDFLSESPAEAILEMMDRHELTPEMLYHHRQGNPVQQRAEPYQDPRIDQLIEQQKQAAQMAQAQQTKAALDAFGAEQANGKALRPHWNDVKLEIKHILPLVYSQNPDLNDYEALHQAYERAVYANPQVRTKLVTQNNQVKFSDDKTARAKDTATASLSSSSSRAAEPPKTAKTVRDALNLAADQHGLR